MPNIQFQFRRDTSANWTAYAPVLASGEMGIELDSNLFKIGDGVTDWAKYSKSGLSKELSFRTFYLMVTTKF